MRFDMKGFWIFLLIILVVVAFIYLVFLIKKLEVKHLTKLRNNVLATSERYKELVSVIDEIGFHKDVEQVYTFVQPVNTKPKFDKFNFDLFFKSKVSDEFYRMNKLISKVKQNKEKYSEFQELFNTIYSSVPNGAKKRDIEYYDIEKKMLLECRNMITTDPIIVCLVRYTSPQGRNNYENTKTYTFQDLIRFRDNIIIETEEKNSEAYRKKVERGKMSDSLRYDVMKRDGFRCKLCGREAEDGAKLEVDHIMPISKGGKTTMSNLQTLCKECNRGKRDKYDNDSDEYIDISSC